MPYVIRASLRTGWQGWDETIPTRPPTVQIEPLTAKATGLLDRCGREIWSQPDPIGFRFQENQ
jgi:hypothetical protein